MKKRGILSLAVWMALLFCLPAGTGHALSLPSVGVSLDFPGDWHVFTPASVTLYEVMLREEAGMDAQEMLSRYMADDIVAEGFSDDYSRNLRLMVTTDTRSESIFHIDRTTASQRRGILASFTDASNWQLTPYRYQDAEWSIHPTLGRFALLRYNYVVDGEIQARGLQYFTIRNGRNYILETTITEGRFGNSDLAAFARHLDGLTFTEELEAPPLPVSLSLDGQIPGETGTGSLRLSGTATSRAGISVVGSLSGEDPRVLAQGEAKKDGTFSVEVQLEQAGTYYLAVIASLPDMEDAQVGGTVRYQPGLLTVTVDNIPGETYAFPSYELSGSAPNGASLHLVIGGEARPVTVNRQGRFSITVDTAQEGVYEMELVANMEGYETRRIAIAFTRVVTEDERLQAMMDSSRRLTFAQMTQGAADHVGEVVHLSGQVVDVVQGESVWFLRLYVTQEKKVWKDLVSLTMTTERSLAPGQVVDFYATLGQPYTDTDEAGQERIVPSLELLWLVE